MTLPVVVILTIWSAVGNIRLEYSNVVQDSKVNNNVWLYYNNTMSCSQEISESSWWHTYYSQAIIIVESWEFTWTQYFNTFACNLSQNLQLITVRACCSNNLVIFQCIFIFYTIVMFTFLFILTFLVANVNRLEFRREGLGSHRAVALAVLPLPALYVVWAILLVNFPVVRYRALLWIEFTLTGLQPMLIMIVLLAPNVSWAAHAMCH